MATKARRGEEDSDRINGMVRMIGRMTRAGLGGQGRACREGMGGEDGVRGSGRRRSEKGSFWQNWPCRGGLPKGYGGGPP